MVMTGILSTNENSTAQLSVRTPNLRKKKTLHFLDFYLQWFRNRELTTIMFLAINPKKKCID